MKRCQSCGRLTELFEDFAGLDQSSIYCSSCADGSGKLRSFEEVLENLTQRIAKTDGFDEQASRNAALQILGRQPAWEPKFRKEEGMKTNKSRLFLFFVATVFTIAAGGVTWWLTTNYYENQKKPYMLHVANGDNPFTNIQTTKKDGYSIKEFRCRGDQRINEFTNGNLTVDSFDQFNAEIDGSYCYTSLNLGIEDHDFIFKKHSYNQYRSNINEYDINNNKYTIEKNRYRLFFYNEYQQSDINVYNSYCTYNNEEYNFINKDETTVKMNYNKSHYDDDNSCNNEILYTDGMTSIELFPEKSNRIICERKIYIFNNKRKVKEISFPQDNYQIRCEMASNRYVIVSLHEYFKDRYLIIDLHNYDYRITGLDYANEVYVFDDEILFLNPDDQLYQYDFMTDNSKMLYQMSHPMILRSYYNNKKNCRYLIVEYFTGGYDKIDLITNKIEDLNIINSMYIPRIIGKYALTCNANNFSTTIMYYFINYTNDSSDEWSWHEDFGEIKKEINANGDILNNLYITDLETNKMTLLDDKFTGELTIDGNNIAWTRNAGPKDDQWKNVCYTVLP